MKRNISALSALFLFLVSVSGIAAADSGTASVYVSVAKYEPFPAEAGQFLDVWFKAENLGSGTSGGTTLELLPKFPFSLEGGDAVQSLGTVASGSSLLVKYRVKVDEKATSGDNILQLRYRPAPGAEWITKDVEIFIQAHDAVLSVSGISSAAMSPGKIQAFSVSLENLADTYLKDVSVTLDFSSATLPFASVNSINEKRITAIPPKGTADASFGIITAPDAATGVYKVPLTLKYSDITNKTYTRNYLVGFTVNAVPDFEIAVQKYDTVTEGMAGAATISVSNTGPGAIKFMTMELLPSDSYEMLGETSIYLGNLDPDDYQTGAFKIFVNAGALAGGKTIPLKILLKYRDGLNNPYSENTTLRMRVYSPDEISAYGLGAAGGSNTIIYAVIAIAAIYFVYRRYFRKRKV